VRLDKPKELGGTDNNEDYYWTLENKERVFDIADTCQYVIETIFSILEFQHAFDLIEFGYGIILTYIRTRHTQSPSRKLKISKKQLFIFLRTSNLHYHLELFSAVLEHLLTRSNVLT